MSPKSDDAGVGNSEKPPKEEEDDLPQEVTKHNVACNDEFHSRMEVLKSQEKFDWKVVEPYDGKDWITWEALGLSVKHDKHKLRWRNCADVTHAWTGLVSLKPGQVEPLHQHTTPMIYYILQVQIKQSAEPKSWHNFKK